MTKRELIYLVFEGLNISTDDSDKTEELTSALIDNKRAFLLKQQASLAHWNIPIEVKQEICLDLENVPNVDGMTCFGKILRTKISLPKSVRTKGISGPLSVRKGDRNIIHLSIIPFERLPFVGYNTFISQIIYAAQDYDGRLYLVSNQKKHHLMETIRVGDVWENPEIAMALDCSADTSKDLWDQEYPLDAAMVDTVINLVIKDLTISLAIPEDDTNDSDEERR